MQEGCGDGSTCTSSSNCINEPSQDDCFNQCDGTCVAASYDPNSGDCVLYYECCPGGSKRMLSRSGIVKRETVFGTDGLESNGLTVWVKPGLTIGSK